MESQTPGADAPPRARRASPPTAPAVVAVVVARDPGPWFEETMAAMAGQDYPNLSILVIDANSAEAVKPRVGATAPGAFVRRLDEDPGYGAAANEVLEVVDGARFYLFCHDDVAPAPDTVRLLVEEAYRSNAAVVGPKLVDWDHPRLLLQVGQGTDRVGYGIPLVERGELDQSQHDAVRDVFTAPGPCVLARADLFGFIGGFDEGIRDFLDDVSLCWRAQVAGARVIVAPDAVVRHRDVLARRVGYDERRRLQARHRLRIVLTCYGPLGLFRALLRTIALNVVEVAYALLAGRRRRAGDIVSAWWWNLRRIGQLRAARRQVKSTRRIPDRDVRAAMTRGTARLNQLFRGQLGRGEDRFTGLARGGRQVVDVLGSSSLRASAIVWAAIALVLVGGSRHLLTRGLPAVGEMAAFSSPPIDLLRSWVSGWRTAGLGSESPAPTAFGLIGVLGLTFTGAMGLLRTVLTLGMLPLGAVLAYRLPAATGSRFAQIACLVMYVAVPLPYNALGEGRWGALALYAAAPVLLGILARASQVAPFGTVGGPPGPGIRPHPWRGLALGLGFSTALVATILPAAVVLLVGITVAFVLGGVIALDTRGNLRILGVGLGGAALALVLHLPWSLEFLRPSSTWTSLVGASPSPEPSDLGALLRFEVGPLGSAPLGWFALVAASLPLLIGRGERHLWAVRGWTLAVMSFGAAWAAQRGSTAVSLPPVEVLLVPAAIGLALAAAMGVAAFEVDLPAYRFGWRQIASGLAAAALVVGTVPVLGATFDGRWSMPGGDHPRALASLDAESQEIPFRVLWLGEPAAVPLDGWQLEPGLTYATTDAGSPGVEDLWVGSPDGATSLLGEAVDLARTGQTARLGRLLAPMGVRYVVVAERLAPAPFAAAPLPAPPALTATLAAQLDLEPLDVPAGLTVFRNEAFLPTRAALPSAVEVPDDGGIAAALGLDLSSTPAVLPRTDGHLRWSGRVAADTTVLLSATHSERWELDVDGEPAEEIKPFGWATGFEPTGAGAGALRYHTSSFRYGALALQALAWLWVLRVLVRRRLNPLLQDPEEATLE